MWNIACVPMFCQPSWLFTPHTGQPLHQALMHEAEEACLRCLPQHMWGVCIKKDNKPKHIG